MDAVSAGASVLAFVTLSLQSAKLVYETLTSVKDGPKHVYQIARDVQSLQSTLERLARCRAAGARGDEAFATKLKACADDMTSFAKRLKTLTIDDGTSRLERNWKRVKAFLNEKDLETMGAVFIRHTAALNFHLSTLDRYVAV